MTSKTNSPKKAHSTGESARDFDLDSYPKDSIKVGKKDSAICKPETLPSSDTLRGSIDLKRKELQDLYCRVCDLFPHPLYTHKEIMLKRLEGFNLGVEIARKEFIEWLIYIFHQERRSMFKKSETLDWIDKNLVVKIKELKQQLGGKND